MILSVVHFDSLLWSSLLCILRVSHGLVSCVLWQSIAGWLPKCEDKILNMSPAATDVRTLRIQTEELKVRTHKHVLDLSKFRLYCFVCRCLRFTQFHTTLCCVQVFKIQTSSHYADMQALNHYASALKNLSPMSAESLTPEVREINDRWTMLLANIDEREVSLVSCLIGRYK